MEENSKLKKVVSTKGLVAICLIWVMSLSLVVVNSQFGTNLTLDQILDQAERLGKLEETLERILNSSWYALQKPCSYVVTQISSYTCLQNGTTGKLQAYSTDADIGINWACGNVTESEPMQTIVLKGFFNLDAKIRPRNYTLIDMSQAILNNTGVTTSMIENYDTTNGNKFIRITGGEIAWNDQGSAPKVIKLVKAQDSLVENIYIHNVSSGSDSYAIQYCNCSRSDVRYSTFDNIKSAGIIFVRACMDCDQIGNKATNFGTGSGVSAMYLIFGYSGQEAVRCNIIDCDCNQSAGTDGRGAQIYRYAKDCKIMGGCYRNLVPTDTTNTIHGIDIGHTGVENTCVNCGAYGVTIEGRNHQNGTIGAVIQDEATLQGCKIRGTYTGIYITNGNGSLITDNTIEGYNNSAISLYEQGASQEIDNTRITNNIMSDGGTYSIYVASEINNTVISDNTFIDAGTYVDSGTGTIWSQGNVINGKPCEDYVTLSSVNNATYVAHGLAGTPDFVTITLSVGGGYGWYGSLNSTHVQVYASVTPLNGTMFSKYEP